MRNAKEELTYTLRNSQSFRSLFQKSFT